ncbi:PREDICTED: transmembrane protein fend [Drosophila arizonae]|uniref:Transmembrane protein fend n=1 Tax=Drosophila arizonae TaxID=7263 RepID=A0ABM1PUC5_DROAR|nr:PREDICTED: transmembrane protein fend [Drosophila arizonae]
MFQSIALVLVLVAAQSVAQAPKNANRNAAAASGSGAPAVQLQATETQAATAAAAAAAAAAATPFSSKQLTRCRQSCYQQFARDWNYCTDFVDCRSCWQNCHRQLAPFELRVHHAQRQGALVLTDIGWDEMIANASRQCLITWEVSGGGLMGNLLTDTARAELSLWPDTVYNIQVTCKHKLTGLMRRSLKLNVDTHRLLSAAAAAAANRWTNPSLLPLNVDMLPAATTTTTAANAIATATAPTATATTKTAATATTILQRTRPTDRVYIISALPTASQLSGVVYPAFGALAFFLALLVMFLFLRPQRKRTSDGDADTASLLSGRRSRLSMDNSTLHV